MDVKKILSNFELEHDAKVIFAVDKSRAIYPIYDGSEYDLRFVFIYNRKEKYFFLYSTPNAFRLLDSQERQDFDLKIAKFKTSFEGKDGSYAWQGLDIIAILVQLYEMDPSLIVWVNAPIVHLDDKLFDFGWDVKTWLQSYACYPMLLNNYQRIVLNNFKEYIENNVSVILDKYIQAIWAAGMFVWIKSGACITIDMNFIRILTDIRDQLPPGCYEDIEAIITLKENNTEECARYNHVDNWLLQIMNCSFIEHRRAHGELALHIAETFKIRNPSASSDHIDSFVDIQFVKENWKSGVRCLETMLKDIFYRAFKERPTTIKEDREKFPSFSWYK